MSLKEEFLKMLKEDEAFRYTVAGYIGLTEILSRIDANTAEIRVLQEQVRDLQQQVKVLQEQVAKHGEILTAHTVRLEQQTKTLNEHTVRLDKLTRTLDAIGARWGILSESAFREGMKGVVEKYFGGTVSRWGTFDKQGFVYGFPALVEVDVLVRDSEHLLIGIKSSISRGDVAELQRAAAMYEKEMGVKPKLCIVTPYIDDKAKELAKLLNIEVYSATEI